MSCRAWARVAIVRSSGGEWSQFNCGGWFTMLSPILRRQSLRVLSLAAEYVVGFRYRPRSALVSDHRSGPDHRAFSGSRVLIPTAAAAGLPHPSSQPLSQLVHKALLRGFLDFHDSAATFAHQAKAVHHVADLGFAHEDHRIVSQPGVGAKQYKEIGKAADGHPKVSADALLPCLMDFNSIAADHTRIMQRLGSTKASGINQNINWALSAILSHDAVFANFADAVGYKLNIWPLQCRIEIIGDQHTFAAELVVRRDPGPQFGIGYLCGNMIQRHLFSALAQCLHFPQEAPDANFIQPEQNRAEEPCKKGKSAKALSPALRDAKVFLGDDPRRSALEYRQLRHFGRNLWHKLDCAGARADDGHTLTFERNA